MAGKHTDKELLQFIGLYLDGISHQALVYQYNLEITFVPFMNYVRRFQSHRFEGIQYQKNSRRYSKELKHEAGRLVNTARKMYLKLTL